MNRKGQSSGIAPILLSTAASLSVCVLLVAFATDDQPTVMMNWGKVEESQLMNDYKNAVTSGDSNLVRASGHHSLDLSQPGRHPSLGRKSVHAKRSSMQEAVKELKHLKDVSASVWPSSASKKHVTPSAAQLLAHYKRVSDDSLPKSALHKRSAMTAALELAHFKQLSDEVFPSHTAVKHDSWHQSASQMLAHYRKMSDAAMPTEAHRNRKSAQTAEQELAHLKRLSAQVFPSHALRAQHVYSHSSQIRRHISSPLSAIKQLHSAKATSSLSSTRTIAGGLEITDVKIGSGPEPQVGENIKVNL
jgi:hypothetical protein